MDASEIMRLLALIQERGHEQLYDPRTKVELEQLGAPMSPVTAHLLKAAKVVPPDAPSDSMVMCCVSILPGEMLTIPDNKTGPCAWGCGRTVQYRPWVSIPTVCLYCMSERPKADN